MEPSALKKVETPLMERYETKCTNCGFERHFFGTATEARESARKMGWEFRVSSVSVTPYAVYPPIAHITEQGYCPHCKLLVKEQP